jgi:hypothetical protein
MTDWRTEVERAVTKALSEGEAFVPSDVATPERAEEAARDYLTRWDHEAAIEYEPSEAGVKLVRTSYWKPNGMRLGTEGAP